MNIKNEVKFFYDALMKYSAFFGSFVFWILLAAVLLILRQTRFAFTVLLASLAAMLVEYTIKSFYRKNRPDFKSVSLYSLFQKWQEQSTFPSGHAANMALLMTLFHFEFRMLYLSLFFVLLTILSGLARVYLKRHYWKDVVAGYAMGIIIGLLFAFSGGI